jgi:hypothetical protein
MRKGFLAAMFLVFCPLILAQQSLNNDSVIKLIKAGLSEDLIVSTINASPGTYDTSANGLIALKSAGATDKVVTAIVLKGNAPAALAASPAQAVQPPAPQAPPPPPFHSTDGKIRIYVTDHPIFESNGIAQASGNRHGASAGAATHTQAGDDPRTVEVQADIVKLCPANIIASNNQDRADYILVFRRRGGERSSMFALGGLTGLALSAGAKVDGASLFQADGDMIYATKQNTVEKSIKDICDHIPAPSPVLISTPAAAPTPAPAFAPIPAPAPAPVQAPAPN